MLFSVLMIFLLFKSRVKELKITLIYVAIMMLCNDMRMEKMTRIVELGKTLKIANKTTQFAQKRGEKVGEKLRKNRENSKCK